MSEGSANGGRLKAYRIRNRYKGRLCFENEMIKNGGDGLHRAGGHGLVFEAVWSAAFQNPLNRGFTSAMLALAAVAILGIATRHGAPARISRIAPGTLTAIGVLGTFVGILVGLLQFDVADIGGSVPGLLDGMKTAFVTSVFGTGLGLVVRLASELGRRSEVSAEPKGVEDIVALLAGIRQETAASRQELVGAVDRMRAALSGDSESSLVTQIQRLRTDVTDEMKASRRANEEKIALIADEIRKISTNLAEDTTQVFVEALERAIREFNQRITEQFGENFKHLNVAVGRLLEWQENYREQMQANAKALREGAAGIQAASRGMEAIASKADALVRSATAMQSLLDGLAETRARVHEQLEAFSGMAAAAQVAMPTIQRRLEELTQGFASEVERSLAQGRQAGQAMQASAQAHEAALRNSSDRFAKAVGEAALKAQEAAVAALQDLKQTTQAAVTGTAAVVQAAMPPIQRQIEALTQGFAREVDKALAQGQQASQAMQASTQAHEAALRDGSARFAQAVGEAAAKAQETAAATVRGLEQSMQAALAEAAGAQAVQKKSFEALAIGFETLRTDAAIAGETVQKAIKDVGAAMQKSIAETGEETRKAAAETARTVAQQLQRTADEEFKRIASSLDGQIKQLDKALEQELTKALLALGGQLASLSNQFVTDYAPLTAKLREVVEMARRVAA